ncbi:hypothetical protein TYRP_019673 [Tyrophagus putrescentiae]|nr:hypothetical protein TYRP_019673 [Tyrophagus putrescentiae]
MAKKGRPTPSSPHTPTVFPGDCHSLLSAPQKVKIHSVFQSLKASSTFLEMAPKRSSYIDAGAAAVQTRGPPVLGPNLWLELNLEEGLIRIQLAGARPALTHPLFFPGDCHSLHSAPQKVKIHSVFQSLKASSTFLEMAPKRSSTSIPALLQSNAWAPVLGQTLVGVGRYLKKAHSDPIDSWVRSYLLWPRKGARPALTRPLFFPGDCHSLHSAPQKVKIHSVFQSLKAPAPFWRWLPEELLIDAALLQSKRMSPQFSGQTFGWS